MIELSNEQRKDELLVQAVEHGVGPDTFQPTTDNELLVAAGVWGAYGSVVGVRLDPEEPGWLFFDCYALERADDGRWIPPSASGGSSVPLLFLDRPDHGEPDWQGDEIVSFGGQVAFLRQATVTDVSVLASRQVRTVEIHYREQTIALEVPASGFVTVPIEVVTEKDLVRIRALAENGSAVDDLSYQPLEDGFLSDLAAWRDSATFD